MRVSHHKFLSKHTTISTETKQPVVLIWLQRQWFLLLLISLAAIGYLLPSLSTVLRTDVVLKPSIAGMLLLMSVTLAGSGFAKSFVNWRAMLPALLGGYLLLPLLLAIAIWVGRQVGLPYDLQVGLAIIAAVPTTLASNAILTRLAGGNDALALASTMFSNLLNFIAAPLILGLLVGAAVQFTGDDLLRMGRNLLIVVVLPVGMGQLLRRLAVIRQLAATYKPAIGVLCQILILTVVLTAVSNAAANATNAALPFLALLGLLVVVIVVHLVAAWLCFVSTRLLGANREDQIAAMFAGSQKTLPLGLYLAAGYFVDLTYAALPIIIYHATQLIIDSIIAQRVKPATT